jgi:hypothetical protein
MSKKSPSPEAKRNGMNGKHSSVPENNEPDGGTHVDSLEPWDPAESELLSSGADPWGDDESLRQEMERLAAANQNLIATLGARGGSEDVPTPQAASELDSLRAENAELRSLVVQLEQQQEQASQQQSASWEERQKEYEALLEEKSEVIRALHQRIHELTENQGRTTPEHAPAEPGGTAREQDVVALSEQLEQERRQLEEDEEALMQQMREMEMSMSRERAELARQRNELQRLHNDIRHELEQAARDAGLRERLAPLQRRHQEIGGARTTRAAPSDSPGAGRSTPSAASGPAPPATPRKESGLFRRLFGSGE